MSNVGLTQQKPLSVLLDGLVNVTDENDLMISGISLDSRHIQQGDLFLACAGQKEHGARYIAQAVDQGAIAVAYETDDKDSVEVSNTADMPVIPVSSLRQHVGNIAARFYDHPSHKQFVVGITGTNGKTSCSQYIAQSLTQANKPCGVIGTLGNGLFGELQSTINTTPDALTLQRLLAEMLQQGIHHVVIEVSSHGLDQGRVNGVAFDVAVFTNLSRDHLDYHDSMEAYARAKQQLFNMPDLRYAVINLDDKHGQEILQGLPEGVQSVTYGMASSADVRGSELSLDGDGIHMNVQTSGASGQLQSSLLGRFNASNLLAVLAVLQVAGIKLEEALQQLASVTTVPGRMEKFSGTTPAPVVVVDYAHTPDALQAVLMALREHCDGSLVCVFGCGGDRDKGKRAMMGNVAEKLADKVVITDDNPRHEDGMQIIEDILSGTSQSGRIEVQRDRVKAITQAFNKAQHGDVILVAGKGHEDYQQVGDEKRPYSDRETVKALFGDAA